MAQPPTRTRSRSGATGMRTRIGAALLGTALLLTGCAAGQRAATAIEVSVVDGSEATVGTLDLRNVGITTPDKGSYAAGASANVQLVIVAGGTADKLISVSTPAASSTTLFPTAQAAALGIGSTPSASASAAPSNPGIPIALPAGESTVIGVSASGPVIQISGLAKALFPAMSIQLTFTFQNAGTVTMSVPVRLPSTPVAAPTLDTKPSGAE